MKFILEAWRGNKPLSLVFFGYYLGFQIAFVVLAVTVLPLFPKPSSAFAAATTAIMFSLFVLSYFVWVYVAIWRCAKNSGPVSRIVARIFVVMAVVATVGRMAATAIDTYPKFSAAAAADHNLKR